jgi:alpha-L-fucosidase
VDIYHTSIGRNSNLLLNVPPNREGRIHPADSARLMEFRQAIDACFASVLLQGATLRALYTRGDSRKYAAGHLLDGNYDSYWATDEDVLATSIEISLPDTVSFNRFLIQEYIPLGQRVARFSLETWNESSAEWDLISEGTTIGYRRILRFPRLKAQKLRLHILDALAPPVLNRIGLYDAPDAFDGENRQASPTLPEASLSMGSFPSLNRLEPLMLTLEDTLTLNGFTYIPAGDETASHISRYNLSVSVDGKQWRVVKQAAVFPNIKNNPIRQDARFDKPEQARFIKLETLETTGGDVYSIAELSLIL